MAQARPADIPEEPSISSGTEYNQPSFADRQTLNTPPATDPGMTIAGEGEPDASLSSRPAAEPGESPGHLPQPIPSVDLFADLDDVSPRDTTGILPPADNTMPPRGPIDLFADLPEPAPLEPSPTPITK